MTTVQRIAHTMSFAIHLEATQTIDYGHPDRAAIMTHRAMIDHIPMLATALNSGLHVRLEGPSDDQVWHVEASVEERQVLALLFTHDQYPTSLLHLRGVEASAAAGKWGPLDDAIAYFLAVDPDDIYVTLAKLMGESDVWAPVFLYLWTDAKRRHDVASVPRYNAFYWMLLFETEEVWLQERAQLRGKCMVIWEPNERSCLPEANVFGKYIICRTHDNFDGSLPPSIDQPIFLCALLNYIPLLLATPFGDGGFHLRYFGQEPMRDLITRLVEFLRDFRTYSHSGKIYIRNVHMRVSSSYLCLTVYPSCGLAIYSLSLRLYAFATIQAALNDILVDSYCMGLVVDPNTADGGDPKMWIMDKGATQARPLQLLRLVTTSRYQHAHFWGMNILRPNMTARDTIRQLVQAFKAGYYPFVAGGTAGLGAHLEWLFNFSSGNNSPLTRLMQEILGRSEDSVEPKRIKWLNSWDYCARLSVTRWSRQADHQLVFYEPYPATTPAIMDMTMDDTSHVLDPTYFLRFLDELQMLEAHPDDAPGEFYVT